MEAIKKTFEDLFYRIAVGGVQLESIKDVEGFCLEFKDHENFGEYEIKAKSTMSMIYFHRELFEKSFYIDYELLKTDFNSSECYIFVARALQTSSFISKTNLIKDHVLKFITQGNKNGLIVKLQALEWYLSFYADEINYHADFETVFAEIAQDLGAAPFDNKLPLEERVKQLVLFNKHGAQMVSEFHKSYRKAIPELRAEVLKDYLNKTSLKFYKDVMIRAAKA